MKKQLASILLCALFCAIGAAQSTADSIATPSKPDSLRLPATTDEPVHDISDEGIIPPSFPGGEQALLYYLARKIHYPSEARQNNIQGIVAVTFVVEKNGAVANVNLVKDIGGGCGMETVRVVADMPNWKPATVDGKPVRVRFTLPVRFKLEDNKTDKNGKKKKWYERDALFGN